jgi:hypothetical protein
MALARLERHKPFAAMGKPLEPDGSERIGYQNAAEHDGESDEWLLHFDTPMLFGKPDLSNDAGYAKARENASEALRTDLNQKGPARGAALDCFVAIAPRNDGPAPSLRPPITGKRSSDQDRPGCTLPKIP